MQPFNFETTPKIVCEIGASAQIGALMAARGVRHVGFVTDAPVRALGLTEEAERSIRAAGLACTVVDTIIPDPPEALVEDVASQLTQCDGIVALGGGSALDVAKVVALLNASDQPLGAMYGVGNATGPRLPLILVPTTAGTGSEVTPISILTTGEAQKMGIVSPLLLPDVALLDARLTLGLPRDHTAATGVDAMVHAIEAFTSRHRKNPLSDALAREALTLLSANIERVCDTPQDEAARGAMLLGSCFAGMAFANAPVAAVHALAYPLGGHFKVPHGLSNCLVLPHVLEFNAPAAEDAYAELASICFDGATLADGFRTLAPRIGLKTRLSDVGVGHNHLPMLAEDAMKQTRLLINNPREVTYEDALAIYTKAL
ncbi:alcohol dehydrogenase class IV [Rubricella aquisinus]|uniref:Alcohol dehydrogenase 2 n=1 Tax=Rubricella aquisinus TaxID=2028108 RepID=A0A840WPA1_9RHOB|nr:iron-containing alcohol dehydrogenase [Rubricella aquisinus]MBB5515472.1 alcohol dehydrogenase class IV [Rubricella aquisinus]